MMSGLMKNFDVKESGFTIMEVLVSVFILGAVMTAVLNLMLSGDRINARRSVMAAECLLASSQVELIRMHERSPVMPGDTIYYEIVNKMSYRIERKKVKTEMTKIGGKSSVYAEYSVNVFCVNSNAPGLQTRLLQGFCDDNVLSGQ
jgi:prepilin-type N-terminal cleavage/methylation domain-containing protein